MKYCVRIKITYSQCYDHEIEARDKLEAMNLALIESKGTETHPADEWNWSDCQTFGPEVVDCCPLPE